MSSLTADVVVVGLGVGGESVAGQLAAPRLEVVGLEAELVGGECPSWACIPSKMMLRAAHLLAETRRVPSGGRGRRHRSRLGAGGQAHP